MIGPAIHCDDQDCSEVAKETKARDLGWLMFGGGRRGRTRVDLCPAHARVVVEAVSSAMRKKKVKP